MEVKLIKDHDDYHLVNDKQFVIGTTDESILSCTDKIKLSLKNCQAIELDYDLDELAKEYMKISSIEFDAFKSGFQKALSILGDKKFSEDDVKKAILLSMKYNDVGVIQSLQQTEWDVEIVMETCQVMVQHGDMEFQDFPKLDADGCIILKHK
jgi:hypothetical protein